MAEDTFKIEIPEQGINIEVDKVGLQKFLDEEISFYNRVASVVKTEVILNNKNHSEPRLADNALRALNNLKKQPDDSIEAKPFAKYFADARALKIVIGQGTIGTNVEALISAGDPAQARWIMWLFSQEWMRVDNYLELFAPFRAATFGNPAFKGYMDVQTAEEARVQAIRTRDAIDASETHLESFIEEKTNLFSSLEEIYRRKLVFDEPAKLWETVSQRNTLAWRLWLLLFAALIVGPIFLIAVDWNDLSTKIVALTTTSAGGISLAGVATITVPALLYAWLLKNVSRVFIQSLNLADDAAHRRTLAITYLGLAENPKLKIDEAERALILNALFRPVSATTDDGGPPMGLLDLIRHKP